MAIIYCQLLYLLVIRYYDILFKIGDMVVVLVVVVMLVILCHNVYLFVVM